VETIQSKNQDEDELRLLSHHVLDNAFHDVCFGSDPQGIHGCSPPEMLHLYQQGLYKYAIGQFIKSLTSEQRRRLDLLISEVSCHSARQSDRTFPRFRYPKGITNLKCFTAAEQVGIALLCFLSIYMTKFKMVALKPDPGKKRLVPDEPLLLHCQRFCKLFEKMLILEAWMNQDIHSLTQVRDVAPGKITSFMSEFKATLNRTDGNGLKIPKFHQLKHLPRYILKFGSPNNFSTSRCESHHIDLSKRPAATAQKRDDCFEQQVGRRIVDNIVLKRATDAIRNQQQLEEVIEPGRTKCYGTRFSVVQLEDGGDFVAVSKSGKYDLLPYDKNLLNTFGEAFAAYFPKLDGIPCYTECHRLDEIDGKKYIFRAHPNYKGKPWFDWAIFSWTSKVQGVTEEVPGRIHFFLDLSSPLTKHPDWDNSHYALLQSFRVNETAVVGHPMLLKGSINPRIPFIMADVESIIRDLFVIPHLGKDNDYIVVKPPPHWPQLFDKL
jgi:hypothetical protein